MDGESIILSKDDSGIKAVYSAANLKYYSENILDSICKYFDKIIGTCVIMIYYQKCISKCNLLKQIIFNNYKKYN